MGGVVVKAYSVSPRAENEFPYRGGRHCLSCGSNSSSGAPTTTATTTSDKDNDGDEYEKFFEWCGEEGKIPILAWIQSRFRDATSDELLILGKEARARGGRVKFSILDIELLRLNIAPGVGLRLCGAKTGVVFHATELQVSELKTFVNRARKEIIEKGRSVLVEWR
jgi:hypothetical protein